MRNRLRIEMRLHATLMFKCDRDSPLSHVILMVKVYLKIEKRQNFGVRRQKIMVVNILMLRLLNYLCDNRRNSVEFQNRPQL